MTVYHGRNRCCRTLVTAEAGIKIHDVHEALACPLLGTPLPSVRTSLQSFGTYLPLLPGSDKQFEYSNNER